MGLRRTCDVSILALGYTACLWATVQTDLEDLRMG